MLCTYDIQGTNGDPAKPKRGALALERVTISLDGDKLKITTPEYTFSIGSSIDAYHAGPAQPRGSEGTRDLH